MDTFENPHDSPHHPEDSDTDFTHANFGHSGGSDADVPQLTAMTVGPNVHRLVRRLAAAEGYLELQLPHYSLEELGSLKELGYLREAGQFQAIADLLTGEALRAQSRFDEAIAPLTRAAERFPAPFNQRAFSALEECYAQSGNSIQATAAREAGLASIGAAGEPGTVVQIAIHPIFTAVPQSGR